MTISKKFYKIFLVIFPVFLVFTFWGCKSKNDIKASHTEKPTPTATVFPSPSATPTHILTTTPSPLSTSSPSDYEDHVYLSYKGKGCCQNLSGKVILTVVFVDDEISVWDAEAIESERIFIQNELVLLTHDAQKYDVQLEIKAEYMHISVDGEVGKPAESPQWLAKIAEKLEISPALEINSILEKKYATDEAPVIFILNRTGRAYASSGKTETWPEFALIYSEEDAFRHELYHLYGAVDFYLYKDALAASKIFLPNTIMSSGTETDPLTAYQIGWADTLSASALSFLESTAHITSKDIT
ncbi:MAG: hypothetical protein IKY41_07515 [Clostridia bacterium]|nr:hypothetical protein [Clostridia bacterium]